MKSTNIPEVRLGIVAVRRDCFPIALSTRRRQNIVTACKTKGFEPYECSVTVENETDMLKAVEEVKAAGCNALTVFLGNFGPETPETLIAKYFDGPVMYAAAAEEARRCGLGLNAGHDLDLENLRYFVECIPWTDEVSIGHALICDALYYGLENTVQLYRRELKF